MLKSVTYVCDKTFQLLSLCSVIQKKYLPLNERRNILFCPKDSCVCSTTQTEISSISLAKRFFALREMGSTSTIITAMSLLCHLSNKLAC
jgi:hypothetical protein